MYHAAKKSNIEWTDSAIDAATRVFCAGLPLESDDRSQTPVGKLARGRCLGPDCPCWREGREVTRAALNAAGRLLDGKIYDEFPEVRV